MINEIGNTPKYQKLLGRLQARKNNKQEGDSDRDIENYAKKHWTDCKGKRVYGTDLEKSYNDGYDAEYYNIMKPRYDSICNSIEKYKQRKNESKNMNKKLIRLTESDLHKIVKESVNKIINEIGDTEKGQDALGQVRGRADKRNKLLGGAMGNKYRKISHDAQEKAYSQGEKHGFDIYDPNGAYDKGISKGYEKALAKEPRLHKIVKESVNRILRESNRKEVFTISAFNIENEEDVSDMRYCGQTYYNIDDAIASATEFAQSLIDYGSVVMVTVYAGEYQTESGDIFGEPQDVYTISNSDRRTTAIARKKAGYVTDKVNDYAI